MLLSFPGLHMYLVTSPIAYCPMGGGSDEVLVPSLLSCGSRSYCIEQIKLTPLTVARQGRAELNGCHPRSLLFGHAPHFDFHSVGSLNSV